MHNLWGRLISLLCLAGGVGVDVLILRDTYSEGTRHVGKVLESVPHIYFSWLLLWLGWQFMLLAFCLAPASKR